MRVQYKTFFEMIRAIGSREFCVKYYLGKDIVPLDAYQDLFRIYLDEYPEQEKLREEFFGRSFLYKNRFGKASLILDGSGDYLQLPPSEDWDVPNGSTEVFLKIDFPVPEKNPYQHFINRFMRKV